MVQVQYLNEVDDVIYPDNIDDCTIDIVMIYSYNFKANLYAIKAGEQTVWCNNDDSVEGKILLIIMK